MEKEETDYPIDFSFDWSYGVEISQIKKDIEKLEKLGATHVYIDPYFECGCSYVEFNSIKRL